MKVLFWRVKVAGANFVIKKMLSRGVTLLTKREVALDCPLKIALCNDSRYEKVRKRSRHPIGRF